MANFYILTNNPDVQREYPDITEFYPEARVGTIFAKARDEVHRNARLISHPLAGSLKPNESPYKSIVLSVRGRKLDVDSVQLAEGAVAVLRKMPEKDRSYPPAVLEDFRVIDLDLMRSAMAALPAEYHR